MSSSKIIPGDVCEIGFVSSGSWTLSVVAHMTNENGSFIAPRVYILGTCGYLF